MPTLYNHSLHFYRKLHTYNPSLYRKLLRDGGYEYYGGRVLAITGPDDIIQLHADMQSDYAYICKHYKQTGLNHTTHIVWDTTINVANRFPEHELSVFSFGDDAHQVRPSSQYFKTAKFFNNKNMFIDFCRQHGAPTPATIFGDTEKGIAGNSGLPYPLYLKKAVSASGIGVFRCVSVEELRRNIDKMSGEYQLQQELPATIFLNVQYKGDQDGASHVATTEQILDGVTHAGNRYPSPYNPRPVIDGLADNMALHGLKGIFGLDVAVVEDGYKVIECNARWNGSTYPTLIAQRLHIPAWSTATVKTRYMRLKDIALGNLSYDPKTKTGVILINWGTIKKGILGVLFAGDTHAQQELKAKLMAVL